MVIRKGFGFVHWDGRDVWEEICEVRLNMHLEFCQIFREVNQIADFLMKEGTSVI